MPESVCQDARDKRLRTLYDPIVRRRAVLVGGPALLVAVSGLVLSLGAFGSQQSSGSVRIAVSPQIEHELILGARSWLANQGLKVRAADLSIIKDRNASESPSEGPNAAFVYEDHHFYGSACLTLRPIVRLPPYGPGDEYPSPLAKWPLCVVFSTTSPDRSWTVKYTAASNCGSIGVVLRGLWGKQIPVCKSGSPIFHL